MYFRLFTATIRPHGAHIAYCILRFLCGFMITSLDCPARDSPQVRNECRCPLMRLLPFHLFPLQQHGDSHDLDGGDGNDDDKAMQFARTRCPSAACVVMVAFVFNTARENATPQQNGEVREREFNTAAAAAHGPISKECVHGVCGDRGHGSSTHGALYLFDVFQNICT